MPRAQARGVAALVHNDTRIAGRAHADGVHVDTGIADLSAAVQKLRPKLIVGAGGLRSRHEAMQAGEADPDYLFFGRLDGDTDDDIFHKALDLAAWWSSVFVIPAIVMGGRTIASVETAAREGIEFVALSRAVFDDPRGPAEAVAEAEPPSRQAWRSRGMTRAFLALATLARQPPRRAAAQIVLTPPAADGAAPPDPGCAGAGRRSAAGRTFHRAVGRGRAIAAAAAGRAHGNRQLRKAALPSPTAVLPRRRPRRSRPADARYAATPHGAGVPDADTAPAAPDRREPSGASR